MIFECSDCQKKFARKFSLKRHKRVYQATSNFSKLTHVLYFSVTDFEVGEYNSVWLHHIIQWSNTSHSWKLSKIFISSEAQLTL